MSLVTVSLLIIAAFVLLIFILPLFMRKDYNIQRSVLIEAPNEKVFDYLRQLKNQDNFNKWVQADPHMKREFKGTDGTVGFIYGWNGNKRAGEGEQEITSIEAGKKMDTEIRFVRPFKSIAYASLITENVSDMQTKVTWTNQSRMAYPMNLMLSPIEKMLAKDMDTSLNSLKTILEK